MWCVWGWMSVHDEAVALDVGGKSIGVYQVGGEGTTPHKRTEAKQEWMLCVWPVPGSRQ